MDINLKNACVIFDEGHNVADVAMVVMLVFIAVVDFCSTGFLSLTNINCLTNTQNSTSFEICKKELTRVASELVKFGQQNKTDVSLVSELLQGVLTWLGEVMLRLRPDDFKARRNVWSGQEAVSACCLPYSTSVQNNASIASFNRHFAPLLRLVYLPRIVV